jgi:hypothetical protein
VPLAGVLLMGVPLIDVLLIGVPLIDVPPIGVLLMGVVRIASVPEITPDKLPITLLTL